MGEPPVATAAPAAATAPAATEPAPAPAPAAPAAPAAAEPAVDYAAEAEKWKALARQNEARAKANADAAKANEQQQELLKKVAQQLGLTEATPDPAAITAKLEAAEREAKARARELAVLRTAARVKANGDELLDSNSFLAKIKDLDPGDEEGLKAAIEAAVKQAPAKYGLQHAAPAAAPAGQPAPAASTAGGFNTGVGGARQWTAEDVARATPAEVSKAMKDGLLTAYLAS